jgi:hypothetical protein
MLRATKWGWRKLWQIRTILSDFHAHGGLMRVLSRDEQNKITVQMGVFGCQLDACLLSHCELVLAPS